MLCFTDRLIKNGERQSGESPAGPDIDDRRVPREREVEQERDRPEEMPAPNVLLIGSRDEVDLLVPFEEEPDELLAARVLPLVDAQRVLPADLAEPERLSHYKQLFIENLRLAVIGANAPSVPRHPRRPRR